MILIFKFYLPILLGGQGGKCWRIITKQQVVASDFSQLQKVTSSNFSSLFAIIKTSTGRSLLLFLVERKSLYKKWSYTPWQQQQQKIEMKPLNTPLVVVSWYILSTLLLTRSTHIKKRRNGKKSFKSWKTCFLFIFQVNYIKIYFLRCFQVENPGRSMVTKQ